MRKVALKLKNITNAFVRIEAEDLVLLLDPWLTDGIYDGGWMNYPPVKNPTNALEGATHVFISHVHEDHFDIDLLNSLDRSVRILIPKMFPNHRMKQRLKPMGFEVEEIPLGLPTEIGPDTRLSVVPPMNARGLEFDTLPDIDVREVSVIDTGLIVDHQSAKMVFLSDNMPYTPNDAGACLEQMKGCDLLSFGYNGAGSDYPICYNMDFDDKVAVSENMELKRQSALDTFISMVRPKALLPYSSEFVAAGPAALEFARFYEGRPWLDKKKIAARYQERHGIPAFPALEDDTLIITTNCITYQKGDTDVPGLADVAQKTSEYQPVTYRDRPDTRELQDLIHRAADFFFAAVEKHRLNTDKLLKIHVIDLDITYIFDLEALELLDQDEPIRSFVRCSISSQYLAEILEEYTTWNSASLSFRLRWDRSPDEYDHHLYTSLNFLVSRKH
jgi:hypothetical protein